MSKPDGTAVRNCLHKLGSIFDQLHQILSTLSANSEVSPENRLAIEEIGTRLSAIEKGLEGLEKLIHSLKDTISKQQEENADLTTTLAKVTSYVEELGDRILNADKAKEEHSSQSSQQTEVEGQAESEEQPEDATQSESLLCKVMRIFTATGRVILPINGMESKSDCAEQSSESVSDKSKQVNAKQQTGDAASLHAVSATDASDSTIEHEDVDETDVSRLIRRSEAGLQRLAELIEKRNCKFMQDSSTSSMPYSTDELGIHPGHKYNHRQDKISGRSPGGQCDTLRSGFKIPQGAKRQTEVHYPDACRKCEHLPECKESFKSVSAACCVVDIPQSVPILATTHRTVMMKCSNKGSPHFGQKLVGELPPFCGGTKCYGPNLISLIILLVSFGGMSFNRIVECLKMWFPSITFCEGTISDRLHKFYLNLEVLLCSISIAMLLFAHLHCDETGIGKIKKQTHWVHVVASELYTIMYAHPSRGHLGTLAGGIIQNYKGTIVSDFWSVYNMFKECTHAFCHAHIIRELKLLADVGKSHSDKEQQECANALITFFVRMYQLCKEARERGESKLPDEVISEADAQYTRLVKQAKAAFASTLPPPNPKTGKQSLGKSLSLLERLEKSMEGLVMFYHDLSVPFTNNGGEKPSRMLKLLKKVSGCFRSFEGAAARAAILSLLDSAQKHGINRAVAIQMAVEGRAEEIFPELTPLYHLLQEFNATTDEGELGKLASQLETEMEKLEEVLLAKIKASEQEILEAPDMQGIHKVYAHHSNDAVYAVTHKPAVGEDGSRICNEGGRQKYELKTWGTLTQEGNLVPNVRFLLLSPEQRATLILPDGCEIRRPERSFCLPDRQIAVKVALRNDGCRCLISRFYVPNDRKVYWGIVSETGTVIPSPQYLSLTEEERKHLIFPDGLDLEQLNRISTTLDSLLSPRGDT